MSDPGNERRDGQTADNKTQEVGRAREADSVRRPTQGVRTHGQQGELQTMTSQQNGHGNQQGGNFEKRVGHVRRMAGCY